MACRSFQAGFCDVGGAGACVIGVNALAGCVAARVGALGGAAGGRAEAAKGCDAVMAGAVT